MITHRRNFLRQAALAAGLAPLRLSLGQQPGARGRKPAGPSMSRTFARWVSGLRHEDLPPAVVDRVKGLTLQALASALQGFQLPAGQQAMKVIADEQASVPSGATILVQGGKATQSDAAFANAEMILAGGKWDTFRMLTHPSTSILPAALAAAETGRASGREFLTGLAAGYEVMEVMARGFHAGPVFGIFGAAVAAAKIMRFTEDQVNDAIALCVNLAAGNLESLGLREGPAARNAMLAVALAQLGHRGGETSLEGRAGLYQAYAGSNEGHLTYSFTGDVRTSLEKITADLGKQWLFLETLYRIYSVTGYNL